MAKTMSKETTKKEINETINEAVETKEKEIDLETQNTILTNEIKELKEAMKILFANAEKKESAPTFIDTSSKLDKPCTLIHLWECNPMLPNSIHLNGRVFNFSKFGEKRTFRLTEMQDILSKYFSWFERGIFTLGEDCSDFSEDFGLKVMDIPMSIHQYQKIDELPIDEFTKIINGINMNQKIIIAKTWMQRYEQGNSQYSDIEKIRVLNKATKGFMSNFISSLTINDYE